MIDYTVIFASGEAQLYSYKTQEEADKGIEQIRLDGERKGGIPVVTVNLMRYKK